MISVSFARFCAGICRCVVGVGLVVSSAVETAERFLFRSLRKVEVAMIFSNVSIRFTQTPLRAISRFLFFRFFLGPAVVVFAVRLFCVQSVAVVVSAAVGVAIHGVEGSQSPEDQMRYASLP